MNGSCTPGKDEDSHNLSVGDITVDSVRDHIGWVAIIYCIIPKIINLRGYLLSNFLSYKQ